MDQDTIRSLTARFQAMMAERNRAQINNTSARTIPETITAVTSPRSHPAYQQLISLSNHPESYDEPGLLDKALGVIDLERVYGDADRTSALDQSLGYQDHLIKALLKWFKEDFFQWVNAPKCSLCGSETDGIGAGDPTTDERIKGAGRVEVYRCRANTQHIERFPRYDSVETLLTWRKGRCGEFANCFTLLCIALGSRARWVFNYEDHVWTEVYSTTLKRWVHCDACENAWDSPLIYSVGWGKKMSHCVAFSSSGAQDVTRRYVRDHERRLPPKVPSIVMDAALLDINHRLRSLVSDAERLQFSEEDEHERQELSEYESKAVESITSTTEAQPRQSGTATWKEQRGEDGSR